MSGLPAAVRALLWEYDLEAVESAPEPPDVVLERVMARGGLEAMRWLLATVPAERLRAFLERRGRRVLPPRELRFWCRQAGVGEPEASRWVARARERERSWR